MYQLGTKFYKYVKIYVTISFVVIKDKLVVTRQT